VIVCAVNYNTAHPYSTQADDPKPWLDLPLCWSHEDYHDSALKRLRQVEVAIQKD